MGNIPCRHSNCPRQFASNGNRDEHEKDVRHECPTGCTHCDKIQQGKERAKELERVRAAKRKEREEKVEVYRLEDEATRRKAKQRHEELYQQYLAGEVPDHSTHQHHVSAATLQATYGLGKEESIEKFLSADLSTAPYLARPQEQPSLEALLAFKDRLFIPDDHWDDVRYTFNLDKEYSRHHIETLRTKMNSTLDIHLTEGKRGYQIDIHEYLHWLLPQKVPEEQRHHELPLTFGMDNAQLTRRSKQKQEAGGMRLVIPGAKLSTLKSPAACHLWGIYMGTETPTELQEEFGQSFKQVEQLNVQRQVTAEGKQYHVLPLLCVDMACLAAVLNLTEVYRPKANVKCCFCDCTKDQIHDRQCSGHTAPSIRGRSMLAGLVESLAGAFSSSQSNR